MDTDADNPAPHDSEQRDRLQALYELATEIAELRDLQQVLDLALRHCLALTGSEFGFIGLNTADRKGMDVVAIQGHEVSPAFYEQFHLIMLLRSHLLVRAALDNRPVRSKNARRDPAHIGQPPGHPPVKEYLGVPLCLRGSPIGMIGVANRTGAYADEHEHLLTTYAAQVAIAIHNAQLYQRAQDAAVAEERARIAREMHDNLAQILFYVNTQTEVALTLVRAGHLERTEEELKQLAKAARDAYTEVRADILALRATGTAQGMQESLSAYLPLWQDQSGVRAELVVTPTGGPMPALSSAAEIQIVRIVQEALANVRKHARARQVRMHIRADVGQVIVEIEDDGTGFDPGAQEPHAWPHFGLAMMRERAIALGGSLEIETAPGQGTHVILRMPAAGPSPGVAEPR